MTEYRQGDSMPPRYLTNINNKLDVDPQRDDDASPMSSYGYMLRPTCMFMDRMIAPIIVQSISKNCLQT